MSQVARLLTALLLLTLLAAHSASAVTAPLAAKPASGSFGVLEHRLGVDVLASAGRINEKSALRYDFASGSLVAARETGILANAARGRAAEARVLKDLGLTKNTTVVETAEGRAIPDALTTDLSVEIKDTARVSLTGQLRIQTEAARAAGRESVLVTGENTCISAACSRAFDTIVKRSDLGPPQ